MLSIKQLPVKYEISIITIVWQQHISLIEYTYTLG